MFISHITNPLLYTQLFEWGCGNKKDQDLQQADAGDIYLSI